MISASLRKRFEYGLTIKLKRLQVVEGCADNATTKRRRHP
jgi:hypothetical protein